MPIRSTKDISSKFKVFKGSRLLITGIRDKFIDARFPRVARRGDDISIRPIILHCRDPRHPTSSFLRIQFPVEVAFASLLTWSVEDTLRYRSIFKCSEQ
ncbi:hypothetical protein PSHT_08447 [Puccinia striiformis]|uniref:Uncharacterized protein n=1 Tax=Puccinia striiformis TaxID=27350 RepID=A0A2S4VPR7_9BASI|nr:hypothetical protein PSHT_08447 [Puccinia striiformis]